ncbi:hypothetical protein PV327_004590 [Microctonus hyperodae]|uniref:MSP domain-containing protein n=1 Tax=Microctonus hyperodae TaxID=165561 RepID=A0AA39KMV2_MICHY|nr:hypothetical protein PV327_004590 [Microctonus hyperodae]
MTKPEQVLIIEPQGELRFRGPFTGSPVTSYIKLINPTSQKVYFKIKTTAPRRYCVRPNNGMLKAKEIIEIAVCLQPFEFDPTEKNKHKFMVQTVIAPEGDTDDFVNDVWKDIDDDLVMEYKLKCVFENPVSTNAPGKPSETNASKADSNTTNGKNKATGDAIKPSLTPLRESEDMLFRAATKIQELKIEESQLRQECLKLKEEILKSQSILDKGANESSGRFTSGPVERSNPPLSLSSTTMIAAVVMVIVGYFLGKLI